jgi:hypothetical protein
MPRYSAIPASAAQDAARVAYHAPVLHILTVNVGW